MIFCDFVLFVSDFFVISRKVYEKKQRFAPRLNLPSRMITIHCLSLMMFQISRSVSAVVSEAKLIGNKENIEKLLILKMLNFYVEMRNFQYYGLIHVS